MAIGQGVFPMEKDRRSAEQDRRRKKRPHLKVFSGNSNRPLARAICGHLGIRLGRARVGRFPDRELDIQLEESVRGCDCFVVQSTCPPVDEHWMELFSLVSDLKMSSAARVTAVIPYYGYARQERKGKGKVPINAKLVAKLLETAGVDRVIMLDLHAPAIQGFFNVPTDHLTARPVLVHALMDEDFETIGAPDQGASVMVEDYAQANRLNRKVATIGKRRKDGANVEFRYILGEEHVHDKRVMVLDDIIATGGTLIQAADKFHDEGAVSVDMCGIHGVFAGNAFKKLLANRQDGKPIVRRVYITDSIPLGERLPSGYPVDKIKVISVAKLLGEAILQTHTEGSVSQLFEVDPYLRAVRSELPTGSADELDVVDADASGEQG